MKPITLFLVASLSFGTLWAQIPTNKTVYDCTGSSRNIQNTLGTGKALIVLSKGVDCSICRSSAPGWQTWAAANTTNVAVWGAITYRYNPASFPTSNMCTITDNWEVTYGWNDIFTFPDSNRSFYAVTTPRYYVYSAIDSSLVYQGSSSSTARSTAIAQSTVGLNASILENAKVFNYNGQVILKELPTAIETIKIYNTNAQLVYERRNTAPNTTIDVSNFEKGLYILQFNSSKGIESKKLIF